MCWTSGFGFILKLTIALAHKALLLLLPDDRVTLSSVSSNVAAALVRTQGPSKMDRTFYSRSTLSLLIVWQDQLLFQAAHTGPSPNVKQDLM